MIRVAVLLTLCFMHHVNCGAIPEDKPAGICRTKGPFAHKPTQDDCKRCDRIRNSAMFFEEPCACRTYYRCIPRNGRPFEVITTKCTECMCWDQDKKTCVRDTTLNAAELQRCTKPQSSGELTLTSDDRCVALSSNFPFGYNQMFAADLTDPSRYFMFVWTIPYKMRCAPGTEFSVIDCGCTNRIGVNINKSPSMCLTFDDTNNPYAAGGMYIDHLNVAISPDGVVGNAAHFDGTANIEIPAFDNKETHLFSLSMFYKRTGSATTSQALISNDECTSVHHNATIQLRSEGRDTLGGGFVTRDNDNINAFNGIVVGVGYWHHVAMTFDGSHVTMYVNGTRTGTPVPSTGPIKAANCPLRLGSFHSGGFFTGYMDQVCFYDHALTDSEVASLYSNPSDVMSPGSQQSQEEDSK